MHKHLIIAAALALTACGTNEVEQATAELAIVKRHGTPADICEGWRKLEAAQLKARNVAGYREAKLYADLACVPRY